MSCPICGGETLRQYRPFCSKRCADVDLSRWMKGTYAVPTEADEDVEAALEEAAQESRRPH